MAVVKVSFIVPLFNHVEYSKAMLSSLCCSLPNDLSYEIILIDDASSDSTVQWLNSLDSSFIKKILNPINLGYAKSNNIAVSQAKGKFIALINNDLLFDSGWLEPILEILENPCCNAGIVGNIQYRVIDNSIDHAGVVLTNIGKIDHLHNLPSEVDGFVRSFAVTGACMLLCREDFVDAGFFDEAYLNGAEDIDLCFKVRASGKYIYLSSKSFIHHHVSLSRDRFNIQNEINSRRLHAKWRNELKQQLTKQWVILLQNADNSFFQYIDGDLYPGFITKFYNAAGVIAEHFLLREEQRWSKLIDNVDLNQDIASRTQFKGLRFIDSHNLYLINTKPEVVLKGVDSVVNFYVCGRRIDPANQDNLAITISVNHVQYKILRLESGPNINLGIISPILLKGIDNVFRIEVNFIDPDDFELLGDASHLIYISHFVIDDKLVKKH